MEFVELLVMVTYTFILRNGFSHIKNNKTDQSRLYVTNAEESDIKKEIIDVVDKHFRTEATSQDSP